MTYHHVTWVRSRDTSRPDQKPRHCLVCSRSVWLLYVSLRQPRFLSFFRFFLLNAPVRTARVVPDFGSGSGSGKSGIRPFSAIWPSPAPAKFLAGFTGFGGCLCSCSMFSYLPIKLTHVADREVVYSGFCYPDEKNIQNSLNSTNFVKNWQIVTKHSKH